MAQERDGIKSDENRICSGESQGHAIAERKRRLRKRLLEQRAAIGEAQRKRTDGLLVQQLQDSALFQEAEVVFAYVSFGPEVDTQVLIQIALDAGKKVAVPRCVPNTRQLEWHYVESLADLAPGTHGILEPGPDARTLVDWEELAALCGCSKMNSSVHPQGDSADCGQLVLKEPIGNVACKGRGAYANGRSAAAPREGETSACGSDAGRGEGAHRAVIALVPGLVFDRMGFRLGYGGGYYDCFLADFPGISIGLVREQFLVESLAQQGVLDGFDQPVDCIATENGLLCYP